jgi:tetratricopeptide (TPR) repeat protein
VNVAAQRVEHLRELGRLDDAEREARQALAAEPEDPELLNALAAVLLRAERHAEGLAAAEAATALAPQDERAHRLRAQLLARLGRHAEALQAAYICVSLAPEEPYAAQAYAYVLQRAGRLQDALQVARRAVELDPAPPGPHYTLAGIAADLGYRHIARQAYTETLRLDPEHAAARHDLAVLDSHAHRPARSLRGLIDAGMLDPAMPQVLTTVTAVLWQMSWRLRMYVALATLVCIAASSEADPDASIWSTRIAALVVLLVGAAIGWWSVRDLPRQTRPVVSAALRRDGPLRFTYVAIAVCLVLFALVAITGEGMFAAPAWLVLGLLGVVALIVRMRIRRSGW